MGRELKRVALDFAWPLDKTWEGFLNPFYTAKKCPHCDNGYSDAAKHLKDLWYGYASFRPEDRGSVPFKTNHPTIRERARRNYPDHPPTSMALAVEASRLCNYFNSMWMHHLNQDDVNALIEDGRLMDFTHTCGKDGWQKRENFVMPTAQEVNEWSLNGLGHDSINQWVVVKAECKRLGVDLDCVHCKGSAEVWETPEEKAIYDAWTPTEPPAGEGYQIWETVSEGSPISPVFADPKELAEYMAQTRWGADEGTSADTWLKFILGPGWAPSMVLSGGKMYVNAEIVNIPKED